MPILNLEDLITSLFDCVCSSPGCEVVRNEVFESMKSLAAKQPTTLLTCGHAYLVKDFKLSASTRAFIMRSIEAVAENEQLMDYVDMQLLLLIINLATQEMTSPASKDVDTEWADASRDVLVRMARGCLVQPVGEALLTKFPPGVTAGPHRYVVICLGTIAQNNPHGFMHFLCDVLSRAIGVLTHVKADIVKRAWARAISSFCQAIHECHHSQKDGNSVAAENNLEHPLMYADQAESVYDVVFLWMVSKDPVVRAETVECIGELCGVISMSKVLADVKKIVPSFLGVYRKATSDHHVIMQGICRFLEVACGGSEESSPLSSFLDDLLNALFPHSCVDVDEVAVSSPSSLVFRNYAVAVRCFHVAATRFADRIVYYLLHKMQHVQDMQRMGAINILRHLLNSSAAQMDDKRQLVMMGLRKLLSSENVTHTPRVSRVMVQLCIALAEHTYIDTDGGEHVIAFLVRNLVASSDSDSAPNRRVEVDPNGLAQLRTQCALALNTISSNSPCAQKFLWPYLLEFVCSEKYSIVIADLFMCLSTLLQKDFESGQQTDFVTGFDNSRVPEKHEVLSRLFVCLCNAPMNGTLTRRARESLQFMKSAVVWFHPAAAVQECILQRADELFIFLKDLTGTSALSPNGEGSAPERRASRVARWHESVLAALEAIQTTTPQGEWRQEFAMSLAKHIDLYSRSSEEKGFLLRCLGVVLSKITLRSFVVDHLQLIFRSTNHLSSAERVACARAVAAVAKSHCDVIITELENVSKWEHAKKSYGLFGFIKDAMPMRQYSDVDGVHLRATLMLCYGFVVQACPSDVLPQRLQQTILPFLRNYMANQKQERVVREALLETMHLIALYLHPCRLGAEFLFDQRNELLAYLKDYVESESTEALSSAIPLLACKAAAALVQLELPLTEAEALDLGRVLSHAVLPISREKSGLKTIAWWMLLSSSSASFLPPASSLPSRHLANRINDDESATTMDATVLQYNSFLTAIVVATPSVAAVTTLLKMLQPFYSLAEHERLRSVEASVVVLKTYLDHARDIKLGTASDFVPLPSLLARLGPRLVDSLCSVRLHSLSALVLALRIAHVHKGHGLDSEPRIFDVAAFASEFLSEEGKMNGQNAKEAIGKFAQVVESRLPQSQIQDYLSALLEMFEDRQSLVSAGAAQLLTRVLADRGASLDLESETLVSALLTRLSDVQEQTFSDALSALVALSAHQQPVVIAVLLHQPLPYARPLKESWQRLCRERPLFPSMLEHVLELTASALEKPYELLEIGGGSSVKLVMPELCAYASALHEIVKEGEIESCPERAPLLLFTLLQLLFAMVDTQFPHGQKAMPATSESSEATVPFVVTGELRRVCDEKPSCLIPPAIQTLLERTQLGEVVEEMNGARAWSDCTLAERHVSAVSRLLQCLRVHRPEWVEVIVRAGMRDAEREGEHLRALSVTLCSAVITRCPDSKGNFNEALFDDIAAVLQKSLKDKSLRIRKMSIHGMGELADCQASEELSAKYVSVSVSAAMAGLDDSGDRRDEVATASICALNKLMKKASDSQLESILQPLLMKVRPCFDKESSFLRGEAFGLLGEVAERFAFSHAEELVEPAHINLMALLLHMNEECEEVSKACGRTLLRLSALFTAPLVASVAKTHVDSGGHCHNYSLFLKEFSMVLSSSFPDRVNDYALSISNYFKSSLPRVRAAAAELTGELLSSLPPALRSSISKELIFSGLVLLLRDPEDVRVRVATVKAVSNLHAYV